MTPETRAILTAALERANAVVIDIEPCAYGYQFTGRFMKGKREITGADTIDKYMAEQHLLYLGMSDVDGVRYAFIPMATFEPFTKDMRDAFPC